MDIAESDRSVSPRPSYLRRGRYRYFDCRVFDLKATLMSLTDVPPERQKILGLVKGKLPDDEGRM